MSIVLSFKIPQSEYVFAKSIPTKSLGTFETSRATAVSILNSVGVLRGVFGRSLSVVFRATERAGIFLKSRSSESFRRLSRCFRAKLDCGHFLILSDRPIARPCARARRALLALGLSLSLSLSLSLMRDKKNTSACRAVTLSGKNAVKDAKVSERDSSEESEKMGKRDSSEERGPSLVPLA